MYSLLHIFSRLSSPLLLFLFLFLPQSFARNDRDRKRPAETFAILMSDTVKVYSRNKEDSNPSKKGGKTSSLSNIKQKQNKNKLQGLFKKSARRTEILIKKYKIDVNQEVSFVPFGHSLAISTFPTVIAAETGNIPMMEILIKNGADLNRRINEKQVLWPNRFRFSKPSCLVIIAAKTGNIPMMELLIKNGASLDVKMGKNPTIIHESHSAVLVAAAESGSIPMVELLLKHIPDTDNQRLGATLVAAIKEDISMLRFMKEQGIPFHSNCLRGDNLTITEYLLENGFDIKRNRGSALAVACEDGNEPIVRLLLEHGAECDIHTVSGCPSSGTAIVKAGARGNVNILKLLLAKGARIHDTTGGALHKQNALHVASKYNNADVIPFLIQQGLDVNTPTTYGSTPLMLAAERGNLEAAKALLAAGADTSIKDHTGKTAADYAMELSNHAGKTTKGKNGKEYVRLEDTRYPNGPYANKTDAGEIQRLLSETR